VPAVIKQTPSLGRILAMVVFALSCFSIVLFLWINFGGSVPLKPKGYRFSADLSEATLLVNDADVRIAGVSVGRVVKTERVGRYARATIEMESKYAPIPKDTRLTLRQKTLGGETYVELTPGDPRSKRLPDNGRLPASQARETSEIDEILRTVFDPETRRRTQQLLAGFERAVRGRSEDISAALAYAGPFADEGGSLLRVVDEERAAMRRLVRDGGFVLSAVGRRQGELSGLIRAGDRVLATTARRNAELQETVRILPTTLRELQPTFARLESFSNEARPVLRALRPAGRALGPALVDAAALAPDLRRLFREVDTVIDVSRRALPATTRTVNAARPVFQQLHAALRDLLPVVDLAGLYRTEVVTGLANFAATFQYTDVSSDGKRRHFFRSVIPYGPESFTVADQRPGTNRHNPYPKPRWLDDILTGLEALDCRNVSNPSLPGASAPPCKQQRPIRFRGLETLYPHVRKDPP
jgi:phospholipid/cholesterol/gamma-HCH transport system substrate-binding protein